MAGQRDVAANTLELIAFGIDITFARLPADQSAFRTGSRLDSLI